MFKAKVTTVYCKVFNICEGRIFDNSAKSEKGEMEVYCHKVLIDQFNKRAVYTFLTGVLVAMEATTCRMSTVFGVSNLVRISSMLKR